MAFDKNVPVNGTVADADVIRSNFVQLAVHHKGPTAPPSPELGYIWLDDDIADNWKLKCYTKNGEAAAAWVSLFDHMESTPVPSTGGGGGASVLPTTFARSHVFDIVSDLVFWQLPVLLSTPSGSGVQVTNVEYPASGIVETGPVLVSDPSSAVSAMLFQTVGGFRVLRIQFNAANIPAWPSVATFQVTWSWNGVDYTLNQSVSTMSEE